MSMKFNKSAFQRELNKAAEKTKEEAVTKLLRERIALLFPDASDITIEYSGDKLSVDGLTEEQNKILEQDLENNPI